MKAFLLYIGLVGIPIISVLFFVRIGENTLSAPASIHGVWDLEAILETGDAGMECSGMVFDGEPILTISQSGIYIEASFNDREKLTLSGTLTDLTITAKESGLSASFFLVAAVDRQPDPDRLEGTLAVSTCSAPISLQGTRRPELNLTGGGR